MERKKRIPKETNSKVLKELEKQTKILEEIRLILDNTWHQVEP